MDTLTPLLTARPKPPGGAFLLTARPRGAWWAAALPGDVVAGSAGWAQAALGTGLSKPAKRAGLQAGGAHPARAAAALSMDGVTGGPIEAGAGLAAVVSVSGGGAGAFTEGSPPAGRAAARPADVVTGCPVLTLALLSTARPKAALGTPLFTLQACVAGLTHTQATDRVATPVAWAAGAGVAAVGSPVPIITGPLAAEAGPSRGTAAMSGLRVAVPIVGTGAPRLAAGPKPACRAWVLAAGAHVTGGAQAGSGPRLTRSAMLTLRADLLAADPPATLGTILITALPLVASRTQPPTPAADGVTGHALRAGARLSASGPKEARHTLILTPLAPEAGLAGTATIPPVTGQRVLPLTQALL